MKRIIVLFLSIIVVPLMAASSLDFNGSNEYIAANSVSTAASFESYLTVETWIYPADIDGDECFLSFHTSSGVNKILFGIYNRRPYISQGGTSDFGTALPQNSWSHIAVTIDALTDTAKVYVNGVYDFYTLITNWPTSDGRFSIAQEWDNDMVSNFFHGRIDEIRIWDVIRSQTQIRQYMCEDVSGAGELLAYYQMSDGSGASLTDNSGNGHTGTMINMDDSNWINDNQIPDGDGSATPYQIKGLNHLYWLSQNSAYWSADFEQMVDIDAMATESWDNGAGFTPIGGYPIRFTGDYNGNGYSMSHLFIDRSSTNRIGMFGTIDLGSEISDLHVLNVNITGASMTGAIVGYLETGNVNQCSSTGNVNGTSDVGGLIGSAANGTISQSFSSATVSGSGNGIGGLVGSSGVSIQNCYAIGNVSGITYVGGLIGTAYDFSTTVNCYSTGSVSGSSLTGGFMGYTNPGDEEMGSAAPVITACFWDTVTSGMATSAAGTGKTTEEMKTLSTYTDSSWDFIDETVNGSDNYWGINNTQHDGYPFLSWEDYTHDYSDTPLPVTLTSFEAMSDKGAVTLVWTTESETENLGYILERKSSGNDWKEIASFMTEEALKGHGTTSETHDYVYMDKNVIAGQTYEYRLSDVSESNKITITATAEITVDASDNAMPDEFGLTNVYPNPFNPVLNVKYHLSDNAPVTVNILNLAGQTVSVLDQGFRNTGSYELQWQADNAPSGIYFVQLQSGEQQSFQKVLLVK